MKFTINTVKLNSMLSKVSKGVGSSKIMPITEYVEILLTEGTLAITATDMANFITCTTSLANSEELGYEDGRAIVKADTLIKLVSKTTAATMKFDFNDKAGKVKGNGTYTLPVYEGEDFPEYEFNNDGSERMEMDTAVLKKMFAVNKAAIAKEMLMPCLTGYNVGSQCITTDGIKMCINEVPVFEDSNVLVTQSLADLLQGLTAEKVIIEREGNKLLFTTTDQIIFGTELDGLEAYPDVTPILSLTFVNMALIPRQQLLDAIERLSLFVDQFDNNGINVKFETGEVILQDLKKNSTESIKLEEHVAGESCDDILFNIQYLKDVLSVLSEDNVHVEYGEGLPLMIREKDINLVLSSMSTGEEESND